MDEISQRAEQFGGRLHQAFLGWYIEAEFGRADWKFTDDARDGGIDAIVWRPDDVPPVIIVQSKFAEHVSGSRLSRRAYREFRDVVDAFHYREKAFDEFLSSARDDLRQIYRRAFEHLSALNNWLVEKRAFRLVTTTNKRPRAEFNSIPGNSFVYADDVLRLYEEYRRDTTPRARPLELTVEDKLTYRDPGRAATSYLFNARLADFRRYLDRNEVARLVARNIRYNLGGKIGREIRKTYEGEPSKFWYLHNGLTVICDHFTESGQIATLTNPSVVNGAQTLYAISGSARKDSAALVTTRVIVRNDGRKQLEDDEWVQSIIQGVNTQNRVRTFDLRSNEPEQVELQNRFRELKVFYERRRGAWREFRNEPKYRNFGRLDLRTLGNILAAVSDNDGRGVLLVKRGVDAIFGDKDQYQKLFPSRAKVARRFKRIYFAYRLYDLLSRYGYRNMKEFHKQHHAFWNTLWISHRGMTSVPKLFSTTSLRVIQDSFDDFGSRGARGRRARKILKQTRTAVWSAWRKAKRTDPEHWTPNNFFKSKFGNRKTSTLALPGVRPELHALGRYICRPR